jgi:hypothetical protein
MHNKKSLLYMPCDTIGFVKDLPKVDILVHECGILSQEVKHEISFEAMLQRIRLATP